MFSFSAITDFLSANTQQIITIIVVYLAGELLLAILARRIALSSARGDAKGRSKRTATIAHLVNGTGRGVLLVIILIWILRLFAIDPTPILASAGVVGLAIGFGAQALVKDFVSGIFIIAENQYGVGDEVTIGSFEGRVECLSIRSTVLRNKDDHTVYVPNGSITTVVNRTTSRVKCDT